MLIRSSVICQQSQMSTISNVNNVKCQQCQMSTMSNVNNVNNVNNVKLSNCQNVKLSIKLSQYVMNYQSVWINLAHRLCTDFQYFCISLNIMCVFLLFSTTIQNMVNAITVFVFHYCFGKYHLFPLHKIGQTDGTENWFI